MDLTDAIDGVGLKPSKEPGEDLLRLAKETAAAVDTEREAKAKAAVLRSDLLRAMQEADVFSLNLPDRLIEIKQQKETNLTKRDLKEILGQAEANRVWKAIPIKVREYLDIPDPARGIG